MRNESDETQYTDEMKLLVIEHPLNTEVAPDINGKMTVFKKAFPSVSVTDENGKDITLFFKNKDDIQWQTDMPYDSSSIGKNLKHELIFKFPKPEYAGKVKFLLNAGTAQWGEDMIRVMLNMRGDKVDKWYENMNSNGAEFIKLYKFMEREELYILKANVLVNDKWITKSIIPAGGPYIDEDRIVELDISDVTGDTLYIKLTPPYGYWKFDYAGMIYESTNPSNITELSVSNAKDENGFDIKDSLKWIDGKYYSMPELTNFAKIEFEAPAISNEKSNDMKQSLFLKTTGYYELHLKKDKPEQTELIEKIYNTPGMILEITMNEYFKKIKSLGLLEK
ncbi:MAG: hypothetical protein IPL53_14970 [Ignavibacteria bacterium]|nr:hypothetical protein [Ignavibacteria bacterium]